MQSKAQREAELTGWIEGDLQSITDRMSTLGRHPSAVGDVINAVRLTFSDTSLGVDDALEKARATLGEHVADPELIEAIQQYIAHYNTLLFQRGVYALEQGETVPLEMLE